MNNVTRLKHLYDKHGAEERVHMDLACLAGLRAADMQQECSPSQYIYFSLSEFIVWDLGLDLDWIKG